MLAKTASFVSLIVVSPSLTFMSFGIRTAMSLSNENALVASKDDFTGDEDGGLMGLTP